MKLTKIVAGAEILDKKGINGLVQAEFKHSIRETAASCHYNGPRIPEHVWDEVMSFFRWTYQEFKSESQVRMFVNMKAKTWKAWAFPQEANTGMSARELDKINGIENEEFNKQRSQFADSEGWIYFATIHHHCGMGAFQSGTDEHNEKGIDGLHITMGKMGEKVHDMHARFYINGYCFDPDMSLFWDVGKAVEFVPHHIGSVNAFDWVARWQMCQVNDVEFPQQWKDNVQAKKAEIVVHRDYSYGGGLGYTPNYATRAGTPWERGQRALVRIIRETLRTPGLTIEEIRKKIGIMIQDSACELILKIAKEYDVDLDDIEGHLHRCDDIISEMAQNKPIEISDGKKGGGKKHKHKFVYTPKGVVDATETTPTSPQAMTGNEAYGMMD